MLQNILSLMIVVILCTISRSFGIGVFAFPVDSLKEQIIDQKIIQYDLILLDIRTPFDVGEGIIASENCRPYHISYDLDDWEGRSEDLPKELPIIIYCNGGSRALQAAQFLITKGYEKVAVLDGGVQSYKGTLRDSSFIKPWSDLPQPSYQYASSIRHEIGSVKILNIAHNKIDNLQFNLIGQKINPCRLHPEVPVLLIEKQGVFGRKKMFGFR